MFLSVITTYFLLGTARKVDYIPRAQGNNQIIMAETAQGNYLFEGNGFKVGDSILLFMGDNGTETEKDDIVYDVILK